nr:esterase LipW [Streptomyces tsukubensis NRRL18488]
MIMGNAWPVLPRLLRAGAEPLQLAVVSAEYRPAPGAATAWRRPSPCSPAIARAP